ncbi:MAG: hypothetical protein H6820_13410 [Phycisphaerales bacterium]|nr:hypothetical protein [Phycisphaerales bacterium]
MTNLIELLRHFDPSAGVWHGLLDATFKATVILLVAVFAVLAMRRAAPRYRHTVLSIAVFGVLVVPLLSSIMPRYRVPLLPDPDASTARFVPPASSIVDASSADMNPRIFEPERSPAGEEKRSNITLAAAVRNDAAEGSTRALEMGLPQCPMTNDSSPAVYASRLPSTEIQARSVDGRPDLLTIDPVMAAIALWLSGLLLGLAWMLVGTLRVNRWLRNGEAVVDPTARRVVRQVSQGLGLRQTIRLIETDAIDSPITWGEMRPIVMLPSNWTDWPIERLRIVLLHELTHVRRHDWLVQMGARLACVVHWFNPLVWFVARRLEEVRELACDDDVVRIGTRPSTYAETLLDIATRMRRRPMVAAVALNMAARTRLEGRLVSILGRESGNHRRGLMLNGALLVVASTVLVMSAIEPWQNVDHQSMPLLGGTPTGVRSAQAPLIEAFSITDAPAVSDSPARNAIQLAAGIRSWQENFRPAPFEARTRPTRRSAAVVLAGFTDRLAGGPATFSAGAPAADHHASDRLLDRAAKDRQLLWEQATATYANAERAVRRAVLSGDFDEAMRGVDRSAQVIESARSFAPNADAVDDYRRRVAALRTYVADEARQYEEQAVRSKLEEIKQREAVRLAAMSDAKRRVVEELMTRAVALNGEQRFDEAMQVLDQVIAADPNHERAIWLRQLIEDVNQSRRDRAAVRARHQEGRSLYIDVDEDGIPYGDVIRYPSDWVQKSARRRSNEEVRESEETRIARSRLRTRAPEIRFDGMTFEDVVDRLRTLTGLNIVPNWAAMEAVAVEKDAEVTLTLTDVTFEKTLDLVLSEVGGGEVELGYEIDEGILRISTKEDLSRRTHFASYDIRDLIVSIPNFKGPDIDISNAGQNQNQTGGIGGGRFIGNGGGSGGIGGGSGGGGAGGGGGSLFEDSGEEDEEQNVDDAIGPLIDLIQQTIEPESWRAAGGNVGSIGVLNQQLIVTQTSNAHAQLRDL